MGALRLRPNPASLYHQVLRYMSHLGDVLVAGLLGRTLLQVLHVHFRPGNKNDMFRPQRTRFVIYACWHHQSKLVGCFHSGAKIRGRGCELGWGMYACLTHGMQWCFGPNCGD